MTEGFNPAYDGPNSSQVRFLRVQNSEGRGPYSGGNVLPGMATAQHPAPSQDGLSLPFYTRSLYRFGFRSWQQLHAWMMPTNLRLLDEDHPGEWNVIEYDLPRITVLNGGRQSVALAAALDDTHARKKYPILDVIEAFPAIPAGEWDYSW